MTIHVNISDAKTRLSKLVATAVRGEDVMLAKPGTPQIRLVAVEETDVLQRHRVGERRRQAFGMLKDAFAKHDTGIAALKADRPSPGDRAERIVGLPD